MPPRPDEDNLQYENPVMASDDEEELQIDPGDGIFRSKSGTPEDIGALDKVSKKLRELGFSGVGGVEEMESMLDKLHDRWGFLPHHLPALHPSCSTSAAAC